MGLSSWFAKRNGIDVLTASAFGDDVEERATYSASDPALAIFFGGNPLGGISVSESTALTLSAVYRAVSLVAGSIGSLPLRTLQDDQAGLSQRAVSFLDNPGGDRYTPVEWAELVMVHLLLHGNAYLQHIYNASRQLVALYPVHPLSVSTEWDDTRPGGKLHKVNGVNGRGETYSEKFDASSMTQIMGPSLDGLVGISAITRARLSMSTGLAGDKAANRQFVTGAMAAGLVTPKDAESDLSPDEAKAVREAVRKTMSGPENAGGIAVMSRALNFQSWSMSAADAQFLESRKFSVEEVSRWFGVPPHLLSRADQDSNWGTGIAEQNRGLARYTLQPWTNRIEQRTTRLLPAGRKSEFDYSAFIRPAPEDEIQLLIDQAGGPILTVNEARAVRNLGPVPGGDVMRTPVGGAPPAAANSGGPEIPEGAP